MHHHIVPPPRARRIGTCSPGDVERCRADQRSAVSGTARVDRRTKDLAKQLGAGEIAVIDHQDLDRVAGESLAAQVRGGGQRVGVHLWSLPERRAGTAGRRRGRGGRRRSVPRSWTGSPMVTRRRHRGRLAARRRRGGRLRQGARPQDVVRPHGGGPGLDRWRARELRGRTPWSTSRRRPTCSSSHSRSRSCGPTSRTGTCSSWCGVTTTRRTSRRCGPTSASTTPCWSRSTAAPMRCST